MLVYKTALDKNGNLILEKKQKVRNLSVCFLQSNPFGWCELIRKDTAELNKKFVNNFLKDNKINIKNLENIVKWFPFYYTTFLLEVSNSIYNLGTENFKQQLKRIFLSRNIPDTLVDGIPDTLDENTDVKIISEVFFPYIDLNYPIMFLEE